MSDIEYSKDFYGVVKKPNLFTEAERVAKNRELQRRERKEKLYSYFPEKSSSLVTTDQGCADSNKYKG